MSLSVLRTQDCWWVQVPEGARKIDTSAVTTAELLADRAALSTAAQATGPLTDPATLTLLSPVTTPCRVIAQMTNYVSHVRDSGMDPETVPLTFFRKASGSISGPHDDVIKPTHVKLLDYEVEIGLVFGQALEVGTDVAHADLSRLIAGVVITNDISARDVQLPKTQFYEAKSYPTFTPTGPALVLFEDDEFERFTQFRLTLRVNGEVRQNSTVAEMIYPPLDALRALSRFQQVNPGDLLLTGTPGGTALVAPPKPVEIIGALLPPQIKWKAFFRRQANNPRYLKDGDIIEASIATDDGKLDLGIQRTPVRYS